VVAWRRWWQWRCWRPGKPLSLLSSPLSLPRSLPLSSPSLFFQAAVAAVVVELLSWRGAPSCGIRQPRWLAPSSAPATFSSRRGVVVLVRHVRGRGSGGGPQWRTTVASRRWWWWQPVVGGGGGGARSGAVFYFFILLQ
jgi:hypothetical protein